MIAVMATIPSRFKEIKSTLISLINQSEKLDEIVIVVSEKYNNFENYDINILEKTITNLPFKIKITTLPEDYGPNSKVIGALACCAKTNIIICDDDLIYHRDLVKNYKEALNGSPQGTILTQFREEKRISNCDMNHVQGADTYLLTLEFLSKETVFSYCEYFKKFIERCPDGLYQDDYVIALRFYLLGFKVKSCRGKFDPYVVNMNNQYDELHTDSKVHIREENVKNFISVY